MNRVRLTQQLERIVHAIEEEQFPAHVRELYVFGSYARGAPSLGDLDLMVVHDPVSPRLLKQLESQLERKYGKDIFYWPRGMSPQRQFEKAMRRVMRRPGEKMDIVLGLTLDKILQLSSTFTNAHRMMIWSDKDRNWREKIDGIKVNPNAGRHERGHFANSKRFCNGRSEMENISEAIRRGFIKLTRINADEVTPDLNPLYEYWYNHWVECAIFGKASMKLLRHGMWWLQQQRGQTWSRPDPPFGSTAALYSKDSKYAVFLGVPSLFSIHRVLGADRRQLRVCLIPHFKRDEARELYVFERGRKRDKKALEKILYRF